MSDIPLYRRGVEEHVRKTVDEFGRTSWEIDYKIVDKQDDPESARHTKSLQARTEAIEIKVGQKRAVLKEGPKKDQQGFYCQLCDELATDSISWVDHLNSPQHNRLLGMNMKVDRVSVDQVKDKLQSLMPVKKDAPEKKPQKSIDEIRREFEQKELLKKQQKEKKAKAKQSKKNQAAESQQEDELQMFLKS